MLPADHLERFKSTLISGGYNLLLGSGTSLDSTNGLGEPLRSANNFRLDLCKLKGVSDNTTLPRVYSLLSHDERQHELVARFSNCTPGTSLSPLPRYLWRRLFTFNIDDVLEELYAAHSQAKQPLIPLNFDMSFEPTPDRSELQAIHLHGWVREPDSGFVFSYPEYARVMSGLNPWMHLLSEILATESFIIAGTSLNEVDLEYYLSYRSDVTPRRGKGPSLFIEPFPDAATESDCKRFGLTLVKGTFGDFLQWLEKQLPSPPSLAQLIVPDVSAIFHTSADSPSLLKLFSDFRLVLVADKPRGTVPSAFLYGRSAEPDDLDRHLDIPRADTDDIEAVVERMLGRLDTGPRLLTLIDDAGAGKTTIIQRIAYNLAPGPASSCLTGSVANRYFGALDLIRHVNDPIAAVGGRLSRPCRRRERAFTR